jgi:DNA-binding beta-propeller fold protein YncE
MNQTMKHMMHSTAALAVALTTIAAPALAQKPFHVETKWSVAGEGGWDYLTVDSNAHRLYIAHGVKVDAIDLKTGKTLGTIAGLTRCHGVLIAPDGKTGFISDGGANSVVVFDPTNFGTTGKIPAGTNPDGMAYEPTTNTLWAFNGTSKNATVIDAAQRKVIGTLALPGKPEFPAVDGNGTIFVNIEDKNAIVRLDAKSQKMTATWPLAGCESPSGLAFDKAGSRLFSVCDGKKMAVTDSKTGKSLATPTVGEGPDAAGYDAKSKLAFSSNGEDGTLTVIDTSKPGYPAVQTLPTMKGARTMAFDESTGKIYVVSAQFAKKDPAAKRPSALPNTFTVLVVGRD